jgi:hypothetical protein
MFTLEYYTRRPKFSGGSQIDSMLVFQSGNAQATCDGLILNRLSGVWKEFEETALKAPSEIDGRALMWTFESFDDDHELQ